MNLSPLDIQNKSFSTKMRGYNQDEVDDFLDIIVRDYEDIQSKNRELEKQVKLTNEKLEYFNDLKNTLNQSIIVAQDTADKVKLGASSEAEALLNDAKKQSDILVANAKSQATAILTDSRLKGAEILNKSVQDAKTLARETDELKKQTKVFHQRLALMLESQLQQVKTNEWDDILQPFSSTIPDAATTFKDVVADVISNENEATGEIDIPEETSFLSEADIQEPADNNSVSTAETEKESATEIEK
ncbi:MULTISPECIES: DivIVA domain-containing protein [unclassified Enterococcus]|uniref:DivIVA domain-containing protein n=1 Tax=unclassified Enterococcus TaxID=2608891 RepID=UPI0015570A75|nr:MULTISPECIES: DivIVA domain-containing protein [unclassified Enterococcus]MBS7577647.1 DivIVA domain-containing protein [Enterococcus sp. MMGLQ5-2]MBS7584159.1 DivIVA domain-containing protein [Enterococcus sp. MMGLQ5-1]NPD12017.1 DivIVA domain-containing protein [Enterococcus sp. MMGLQ5-1]NPD37480.1 DivIVA domain-containing protein [Enterococcus sp. MMGLQ5-2]